MTGAALAVTGTPPPATPPPPAVAAAAPLDRLPAPDLRSGIAALQAHLSAQPGDADSWAALGQAYVEQARSTADPSRYPQAERALDRSLALRPRDNDQALAGQAALAAARHDFAAALARATRALRINPYSERALAVRVDALVELGRYDEAYTAAVRADRLRPGIPVFTRYAYVLELRGRTVQADHVLRQALDSATAPSDIAYVATALGDLARTQGRYREALARYATALRAAPGHLPAVEGRGRTRAARGDLRGAVADLTTVVRGLPLPDKLGYLGELYEARGDRAQAAAQYAVIGTWTALARANGVATDLDTAIAAGDHGDPAEALRAARAEWSRRHSVHVADALGWALHVNGRDREALRYARLATATGYRNAAFLFHRGAIEADLARHDPGMASEARRSLAAALATDPGFSPLRGPAARRMLAGLDHTAATAAARTGGTP